MDLLLQATVTEALVNTHWLADQVDTFAREWHNPELSLTTSYEPELLGSAGTIAANATWTSDADAILVIYADNFSRFDLRRILDHHFSTKSEMTLGVFSAPNPTRCGIVEIDANGRGISFEEKPAAPKSDLAAAGLYVFSPAIVDEIKRMWNRGEGVFDLGFHVFPSLVSKACVFKINDPIIDIGTIEAYEHVCRNFGR